MIKCNCLTVKGYEINFAYEIGDYDFNRLNELVYSDDLGTFMTFDIETSRYKKHEDEYETFMYISQFCINKDVIFGRTWEDVIEFINNVKEKIKGTLVIYVHNLAYEFQFLKTFFSFKNVFSIDEHCVLKAVTYNDIEFRCSYKLSNMNLLKFIENTPNHYFIKSTGDLDYSILRTPKTILTETEYGYCYNDVRGLYDCILEMLKCDDLKTIPLTSTGFVRRECRNAMRTKEDRKRFKESEIDYTLYTLLKESFRGGNTASNRLHTNEIINNVSSYDISSSYPFAMMFYEYPTGRFNYATIESLEELDQYNNKYCTVARYHFTNLQLKEKEPIPYLSINKCYGVSINNICYNGRVIKAETLSTTITNIDFKIIKNMYDWEELYIEDFYFSRKEKLSVNLRKEIMSFFNDKTTLKGVDEKFYEYVKQKNKLNSIYGMTVSNIVRDLYNFSVEDNAIIKKQLTEEEKKDELNKYNKNRKSFLCYQWGVWVTAYARMRLQEAINVVRNDVVYCDTDSVKYVGNHDADFININNRLMKEIEELDIPCYVLKKNKHKIYMGVWDKEIGYDKFVTMGAKKYAYTQKGEIGVTVSGLSKVNAPVELKEKGGLKAFKKGTVFINSGRVTVEYCNKPTHILKIGDEEIMTGSYINMFDTTYTLGITDTMLNIIEESKNKY